MFTMCIEIETEKRNFTSSAHDNCNERKTFSDGECMISGHTIGFYAFVSRLKKSGSLMVVENELIIANLSKSTLNRHEQVRE